jgi:hypothetical protein
MPHALANPTPPPDRMTLAQAARLTGLPKAYLRELIESGRLAVHLMPEQGQIKQRVALAGLIDAGLMNAESSPDLGELIALVREQSNRIGVLVEQRFQLGAQLGAAIERIASLEDRIQTLPPTPAESPPESELPALEPVAFSANGHDANGRNPGAVALKIGVFGAVAARQGTRLVGRAIQRARR